MTADQAFDNLMAKNAFAIPMAAAPSARRGAGLEEAGEPGVVRVAELIDDAQADYLPKGGGGDDYDDEMARAGVFGHPTETDLEAVLDDGEGGDVASAHLHGARIMGRDARVVEPGDEEPPAARHVNGNGFAAPGGILELGRARRVKRFSYLPFADGAEFETAAREMMTERVAAEPDRKSLAITSAVRGEGRTELAIRLALALAKRVGSRVLLADFDLRKPQAAARLGISLRYFTLADVLRGSCSLAEALVASDEDNLFVLPSRAADGEGGEMLDGDVVQSLLAAMHATFDFTIVDCGPVGQADALILCRNVGAVALAGYCGRSAVGRMHEAVKRLESAGATVAGMLLSGA